MSLDAAILQLIKILPFTDEIKFYLTATLLITVVIIGIVIFLIKKTSLFNLFKSKDCQIDLIEFFKYVGIEFKQPCDLMKMLEERLSTVRPALEELRRLLLEGKVKCWGKGGYTFSNHSYENSRKPIQIIKQDFWENNGIRFEDFMRESSIPESMSITTYPDDVEKKGEERCRDNPVYKELTFSYKDIKACFKKRQYSFEKIKRQKAS